MNCVHMALAYRKSSKSVARKYERSPGMEPNVGGVTHMTVINPGRPRKNPFQWVSGRSGARQKHLSPAYSTMRGARGWAEKHANVSARLAAVDEYGTIVTRPLSRKQVLKNTGRHSTMAYNLRALKKAMRANKRRAMSNSDLLKAAARQIDVSGGRVTARRKSTSKKSTSKATSKSTSKVTAKAASKAAKSAATQAKVAKKAASRAKKAPTKKAATKAATSARKAASKAKKAAKTATSKAKKAKPSSKKAANKAASKARAEARAAEAAANTAATASRRMEHRGRLSRRGPGKFHYSTKVTSKLKHVRGFAPVPFRTGRLFNPPFIHVTSKHPRQAAGIRMAANMLGRISQRRGLPVGQRVQMVEFGPRSKRKGYSVYVPGHVSERAYVRRFRFGGAAKTAHARALRSGYSKKRYSKKPVTANGRSSMRRNSKRKSRRRHSMRRNSKRHSRRSKRMHSNRYIVVKNRGRRSRRLRRNMSIFGVDPINQVAIPGAWAVGGLMAANAISNAVANVEGVRNMIDAGRSADEALWTKSLAGAAAAGALIAFSGKLPAMIRENLTPIVAGIGCAVSVRLLRGNAMLTPYLGRWGAGFNGFGEYVDQPLGAYVQDPSMGEYVDQPLGEYVDQPLGGLGTMYAAAGYPEGVDPGDQSGVDGLMDVMEAAAGVGAYEAAAGMGTLYAAAGMGADAPNGIIPATPGMPGALPIPTFTPKRGPNGYQQPPFVSLQTPIDIARDVTAVMQRDLPIPTSLVTSEGRGSAGGIFSRNIFGGMMS